MTEENTTTEKFEPTHIFATGGSITLAKLRRLPNSSCLNVYLDRPEWNKTPAGMLDDDDGYVGRIYVQEMDMREFPPTKARKETRVHLATPYEYKTRHYYFRPRYDGEGTNCYEPVHIYPLESECAKKLLDSLQENEASLIWPNIDFEKEDRSNEWWGY
tara:strand:- start:266 stop:742 length:477 start_codon:yes stop_codon:yes gene_type:complete